jgi:hypothetical protein
VAFFVCPLCRYSPFRSIKDLVTPMPLRGISPKGANYLELLTPSDPARLSPKGANHRMIPLRGVGIPTVSSDVCCLLPDNFTGSAVDRTCEGDEEKDPRGRCQYLIHSQLIPPSGGSVVDMSEGKGVASPNLMLGGSVKALSER